MSSTLDTSTLTPLPCETCGGGSKVKIRTGSYQGWNGVWEPVYRAEPCETCDGTGERGCQWCGEAAAVVWEHGDAICAACAEEEI